MSSALVRQALELVDPEENVGKRGKRRAKAKHSAGQEPTLPYPRRSKRALAQTDRCTQQTADDNIRKLLALSAPTAHTDLADKIVERAIKGKPLLEKIEVKPDQHKSILFPEEESFKKFEKEHFCS